MLFFYRKRKGPLYNSILILFFCVILCGIMFVYRKHFFLFPLADMVEYPSDVYEEMRFENEMGAWVYPPSGVELTDGTRFLIYFNGNAGNVSTRISNIKVLKKILPSFTIVNLEYPGFGLSGHLNGGLSNIIEECTVAVKSLIRNHAPRDIIFWGESLGAFVQAHVFPEVRDNVSALFQCNGMSSLTSTIAHHVPFIFHALLLPMLGGFKDTASVFRHSLEKKKHRLFLFHADCDTVVPDTQSKELYVDLKASFPDAVQFIQIRGKHNMVLLCSENQDTILETVKQAHIIPSSS